MKINPKLYHVADQVKPLEVQKIDDKEIEVFLMGDFNGILEEFTIGKEQFAVWSSEDGVKYRLFLEDGYYKELGELYTAQINKIWLDFWDEAEMLSTRHTRRFLYPLMILAVVIGIGSMALASIIGDISNYIAIGCFVLMFIGMIVSQKVVKNKITRANINSRDKIIKLLGEKKFDELINKQSEYMDEFFANLYPEDSLDSDDEDENDSEQIKEPKDEVADSNETNDTLEEKTIVDENANKPSDEVVNTEVKDTIEEKPMVDVDSKETLEEEIKKDTIKEDNKE